MTNPIQRAILWFNCNTLEGVYVSFHRDATPYQLVKVARHITTIKTLSEQGYSFKDQKMIVVLTKLVPGQGVTTRTLAMPDLWNLLELQRKESEVAKALASIVTDYLGAYTAFDNVKMFTFTEDEALRWKRHVPEQKH